MQWVDTRASDGFTLQPDTVPDALEAFVNQVVPILQVHGAHRLEYTEPTLRGNLGIGPVPGRVTEVSA